MSKEKSGRRGFLKLESFRPSGLALGSFLIILGLCMPFVITVGSFSIPRKLEEALVLGDEGRLLLVALRLVFLNTIRALPHYLGAFLFSEALRFTRKGRRTVLPNILIIIASISLTYLMIYYVHGIRYDFGAPAIIITCQLILLGALDYDLGGSWKKPLMLCVFLAAFQILDVIPLLNALPFGRGETSWDIKLASEVLGANDLLNTVGLLLFVIITSMGVPLFMLAHDENNLREMHALREQNQRIHAQALMNDLENRTHAEMRHLVHDLKSPLTSMQTFVGILKMESEHANRTQELEYLDNIEQGIDTMSAMISELLSADSRAPVRVDALLTMTMAQVSTLECAPAIKVDNRAPQAYVYINRVLIIRALVNLINNAAGAIEGYAGGKICLCAERFEKEGQPMLRFTVEDNGVGIREDDLPRIWEGGFSTHGTTGLGLGFVKETAERSDGSVALSSRLGFGTRVIIDIPEEVQGE